MNNAVKIGIGGEYDLYIKGVDGSLRTVCKNRKNLITNGLMNAIGADITVSQATAYCRLGSSGTAPDYADNSLGAQVAAASRAGSFSPSWGTGDLAGKKVFTASYTFSAFTASANLQELGLASAGTGGTLYTHALLTDDEGDPITVTVETGEQPVVIYRLVFTPPSGDTVFNVNTGPTPTDYTITVRPAGVGTYSGDGNQSLASLNNVLDAYYGATSSIGPNTGSPTGTRANGAGASITPSTYVSGSFERSYTFSYGASILNVANIGAFVGVGVYPNPFNWQIGISPRLTKASPEILSFTVKFSWARE